MHFYRSKIRTLGAIYVLTCVAPLSYTKYHQFARIIQLIERRIQLVTRLLISYTQTLFATRRGLLVTRRHLFATRLNRDSFKEIHILKQSFSANVLFWHKICVFLCCFEYKKFPSNSIKVRREMWYTGRDSNPQPSEPESDALSIEPPVRLPSHYSSLFLFCKEGSGK